MCHLYSVHAPVNSTLEDAPWHAWWTRVQADIDKVAAPADAVVLVGDHNFTLWGAAGYSADRGEARLERDASRMSDYTVEGLEGPGSPRYTCKGDCAETGLSAYDFPVWRNVSVADFSVGEGWQFGSDHRMFFAVVQLQLPPSFADQFCRRRSLPRRGDGAASDRYTACIHALAACVMSVAPRHGALSDLHSGLVQTCRKHAREASGGSLLSVETFLLKLRGWFSVCAALGAAEDAGLLISDLGDVADSEARIVVGNFLAWFQPLEVGHPLSWSARASHLLAWASATSAELRRTSRAGLLRAAQEHWHDMKYHFNLMQRRLGRPVPAAVDKVRLPDGTLSMDPGVVRKALAEWGSYQARPAFGRPESLEVDPLRFGSALAFFQAAVQAWVPFPRPFRARCDESGISMETPLAWLRRDISWAEFDKALNRKMGMAAGTDLLTQEALRDLPADALHRLFRIIGSHWREGWCGDSWRYPDALKHAWIAPVPKKGYDASTARLRPIAVTSVLARIYNRIIYERVYGFLEDSGCFSERQNGFRKLHNTGSSLASLQRFLSRGPCHLAGLDVQRAFDSVEISFARYYLAHAGVPPAVYEFFFEQLRGARAHVWSRYGQTPTAEEGDFFIRRGGKMGAIETPMLFICLMDPLLHMLSRKYPDALVNAYADDLLLGHADPLVLARMIADTRHYIAQIGARVHAGKSWWLPVQKLAPSDAVLDGIQLVPEGGALTYLGFNIDRDGHIHAVKSVAKALRHARMALPHFGQTGRWAAKYAMAASAGHVLYYGAFAPFSQRVLSQLTMGVLQVVRRCCRLPRDTPLRHLLFPLWEDGVLPLELVYAAGLVSTNMRLIIADSCNGTPASTGRLGFLARSAGSAWPQTALFSGPLRATAGAGADGLRFLWAMSQLSLVGCQVRKGFDPSVGPILFPSVLYSYLRRSSPSGWVPTCDEVGAPVLLAEAAPGLVGAFASFRLCF
eukprot:gene17761-biopygen8077